MLPLLLKNSAVGDVPLTPFFILASVAGGGRLSWRKGYWGIAGRVYYSLTTLLEGFYVLSLMNVGAFGVQLI
jgi:hypothetical protein